MVQLARNFLPRPATLLSSALIGGAFLIPHAGFLIFIALAPFLTEVQRAKSLKAALKETVWLSLVANALVLYFVFFAFQGLFSSGPVMAAAASLAFFIFNELQFYALALGVWWIRRRRPPAIATNFALAALYVAVELAVPKLFADTFGFAAYDLFYLRQIADLAGTHLVTFLIVATSLCAADGFQKKSLRPLIAPALLIAIGTIYGVARASELASLRATSTLSFGVVQANTPEDLKARALSSELEAQKQVVANHVKLTRDLIAQHANVQIVVWPEGAYPFPFRGGYGETYDAMDRELIKTAKSSRKQIIFGGVSTQKRNGHMYNSLQSLSPDGSVQTYRKVILIPVGEYIPGASLVSDKTGDYDSGQSVKNLDVATPSGVTSLVPMICYEALFPAHAARGAKQGGQVILDVADDTSFQSATEAKLHLIAAAFASLATRLPQVRATNSGHSAWIDELGSIHDPSELNKTELLIYEIPLKHAGQTLFTKVSASLLGAWIIVFAILEAISRAVARRR